MNQIMGQPAIPFELADTTGKTYRLEDFHEHWLLMVFHRHLG